MNEHLIIDKFERIGARVKLDHRTTRVRWSNAANINIETDRHGEFFTIASAPDTELDVVDVQPKDRHLLLLIRQPGERLHSPYIKSKILCGHDERHWFVASIPDLPGVRNVVTAKEALKPQPIRDLESGRKGDFLNRHQRKNPLYVRQGEWFFVPEPTSFQTPSAVLRNEPIRRGRGKPHLCEYLARSGGTLVYTHREFPNGLTDVQLSRLFREDASWKTANWEPRRSNPIVYVQGKITHADHATLHLHGWHRVYMNTENQARGSEFVSFLD